MGVTANIDHAVLLSFAAVNVKAAATPVDGSQAQIGHFLHPQTTAQHQHEHGAVPTAFYHSKKMQDILVSQMPGQWSGQAQFTAPFDRILQLNLLLMVKIAVEAADAVQMAVNRFGLQSSV